MNLTISIEPFSTLIEGCIYVVKSKINGSVYSTQPHLLNSNILS